MVLTKDRLAGALFAAIGVFLLVDSRGYEMGSLLRMGPGFFPAMVGALLTLVGVALIGKPSGEEDAPPSGFAWWPFGVILASIVVFALVLERFGLILAVASLVILSSTAMRPFRWVQVIALAAGLTVASVLLFRNLLGLPLDLF